MHINKVENICISLVQACLRAPPVVADEAKLAIVPPAENPATRKVILQGRFGPWLSFVEIPNIRYKKYFIGPGVLACATRVLRVQHARFKMLQIHFP